MVRRTGWTLLAVAFAVPLWVVIVAGPQSAFADTETYPQAQGPLAGKHVVISPGHGVDETGAWDRPLLFGLREDIHVNEIPIVYLQRYLHNAGATVHFVRERSFQHHEIIINNGDPGYSETGSWNTGAVPGRFGAYHWHSTTGGGGPHATVQWTPDFPENGFYPVYVNVVPAANRAKDALYRVHHAGGITELRFDQSKYPESWVFLGEFFFLAGEDPERGSLELSSDAEDGDVLVADAVRFGGGVNSSHQLPRWYEQARLTLEHYGYPDAQSDGNLASRPRYASWMAGLHGEPSASWTSDWRYLSIHTNAFDGTVRGTRTFVYSNGRTPAWGSAGPQSHDAGLEAASDAFGDRMHTQFVDDMRDLWEPTWSGGVGGALRMNFAELRECEHVPSCMIELAFHDNETDAGYIRNAQWRHDAARAMYKGVLRDFDPSATVVPLPPSNVRVTQSTAGEYTVAWTATNDPLESSAAPDHYLVYRSDNGFGWDNGTVVAGGTSETFSADPDEVVYVRVAAVNDGGVSLPSKAVAVRVAAGDNHGGVLVVDGFTRPFTHVVTASTTQPSNVHERYRDNYIVEVLEGILEQEVKSLPVDSALAEAVEAGHVDLRDYHAVIWFLGTESSEHLTFSAAERLAVADYLENAANANLFVSGANLATHLDANGSTEERDFLAQELGAAHAASSAGTYTAEGVVDTPFANLQLTFGDGSSGFWGDYDVDAADVLTTAGGSSVAVLDYSGGAGGVAAVLRTHTRGKVLTMGFPVERIVERGERGALMEAVVETLLADYTPPGQDTTPPTVVLSTPVGDPTDVSPFTVTATFSKPVFGFSLGDILVDNGSASNFDGSGSTYTFDVTPAADGLVTVEVPAAVAEDSSGNPNLAATPLMRTFIAEMSVVLGEVRTEAAASMAPLLELRGSANASLEELYVLVVSGEAAGDPGLVLWSLDLSGHSLGENGRLWVHTGQVTAVPAETAVVVDAGMTLPSAAITVYLVEFDTPPSFPFDIDSNNDGVADNWPSARTVYDVVGWRGTNSGDYVYGGVNLSARYSLKAPPKVAVRYINRVQPQSVMAWYVDQPGLPRELDPSCGATPGGTGTAHGWLMIWAFAVAVALVARRVRLRRRVAHGPHSTSPQAHM